MPKAPTKPKYPVGTRLMRRPEGFVKGFDICSVTNIRCHGTTYVYEVADHNNNATNVMEVTIDILWMKIPAYNKIWSQLNV
jgi:hypothetical protein